MMAAAHAVAEAALRDEAAEQSSNQHQVSKRSIASDPAFTMDMKGVVENTASSPCYESVEFGIIEQQRQQGEIVGEYQQHEEHVVTSSDEAGMQSLIQQMITQDQQHQQQFAAEVAAVAAAEAAIFARPDMHYLTIAQNGTILGATETVTGFPPNTLLVTSAYDAVYDEDLPGLLAVKTHFWDNGEPDVEAYFRRRTLEGNWIWLVAKVASYIGHPVSGIVLVESRVRDERFAHRANRVTRIAAILAQAVEAARLTASCRHYEPGDEAVPETSAEAKGGGASISNPPPELAEDAAAYQAWLQQASEKTDLDNNSDLFGLQNIMQAAVNGFVDDNGNKTEGLKEDSPSLTVTETFDPLSAVKAVRSGICLDMGTMRLFPEEVKLVTLVLTGALPIENIGPLIYTALNSPVMDLAGVLEKYKTDFESKAIACPLNNESPVAQGTGSATRKSHRSRHKREQSKTSFIGKPLLEPTPMHDYKVRCLSPPRLSVVNFSYTYMGNIGIEMLSEILYTENSFLRTVDISFCGIEEKGFLAICRALNERKRRQLPPLQGLILSGNYISYKSAKDIGMALSFSVDKPKAQKRSKVLRKGGGAGGYEEDTESDDDDDLEDDKESFGYPDAKDDASGRRFQNSREFTPKKGAGLQVLHIGSASLSSDALYQILAGLGVDCPIRELSIPSNDIGPLGATLLVDFLEGKGAQLKHPVMPFLDRLDLSNNNLGDDGTAKLTRAISKRVNVNIVDLRLSNNEIGSGGVETIMNKLLQHKLISLSLDKNSIGDQGCQLVAASLQSMHQLSRLNLSFNQIGSRGVNTLMRTLVGCESVTYLGLSGNIMKISGAIAMGFTLAQHPRLEELDLYNCCLSQAAQCHLVAGIISNRWVPMKRMNGFQAGPPMVAIGALDVFAQHLSNEECFRLRRDEQMKTILQWMETNRAAKMNGSDFVDSQHALMDYVSSSDQHFLTPDVVSRMSDVHGAPSQSAYLRMLGWLSQIPFDEDELTTLRKYFYDADGGEGDRGSDGYINLKLRGDLLAALASDVTDEIRDGLPSYETHYSGSAGLDLDKIFKKGNPSQWKNIRGFHDGIQLSEAPVYAEDIHAFDTIFSEGLASSNKKRRMMAELENEDPYGFNEGDLNTLSISRSSISKISKQNLAQGEKDDKVISSVSLKARITMFPPFESKLEALKATAQEMMDQEEDPAQQDIILTQYAEASLTILRQLRYHCMNSGLDGWRKAAIHRKVLIVDDSKVTRKMVSRAFEKANFIVDTAENGVEGVEKLKLSIYDIVFMDIDMPVMNGFEATKALRKWEDKMRPGARQPICALTAAYVDDFERSELMKFKEAGLDVMESKPCNIPRLFKVVDDVSPMFSDLSKSVTQREGGK